MTTKTLLTAIILPLFCSSLAAQDSGSAPTGSRIQPGSMMEIGLHAGHFFVAGDIPYQPGFAGGFHIRKATDYIFSLRADFLAGTAQGQGTGDPNREFKNTWFSGTGFGVLSLNSLRWDRPVRRTNMFVMAGPGFNTFKADNTIWDDGTEARPNAPNVTTDYQVSLHAAAGAGISFRLGPKANIGLEHTAFMGFGKRADLIDGVEVARTGIRTAFRDVVNYSGLRLNFNIGKSSQTEPLYWINPLEVVLNDISKVKSDQEGLRKDSDNDGVPDALDEEPNTPAGATVNTKGKVLDSDGDGIADYLDKEPFYTPKKGEEINSDGVVVNPKIKEGLVTEDRVKLLIDQSLKVYNPVESGDAMAEWFLPMIHFSNNNSQIKYSDFGTLTGVARILKSNPKINIVVTGYTDQTGTEAHNNLLSYKRSIAVVEHLVKTHNLPRERFIVQYRGWEDPIAPLESSYINRRVEFRVATNGDQEMAEPSGKTGK